MAHGQGASEGTLRSARAAAVQIGCSAPTVHRLANTLRIAGRAVITEAGHRRVYYSDADVDAMRSAWETERRDAAA